MHGQIRNMSAVAVAVAGVNSSSDDKEKCV